MLDVPNGAIAQLERYPQIVRIHDNRSITGLNYRTSLTIGSRAVQRGLGLTGAGVGIAIIDSGIAPWHDDLTSRSRPQLYPYGNQRVKAFVDFVDGRAQPYDDEGHGTHVAGIIAGNGVRLATASRRAWRRTRTIWSSEGAGRRTVGAPSATIIAALDWVLSESPSATTSASSTCRSAPASASRYWTDPLTLAAKRGRRRGRRRRGRRRQSPAWNAAGPAAVRRHHRAGQRALGADGRRVESRRHAGSRRDDTMARVQLARSVVHRSGREAGPRCAGHGTVVAGRIRWAASPTRRKAPVLSSAASSTPVQAVPDAERHEHGGAGRGRHGGADAAGESVS